VPESATEIHLQLLSRLATMFSDPGLRDRLRQVRSAEDVLGLLDDWEERPRDA
jgi:PTS system nitrogen regulatory IIA component